MLEANPKNAACFARFHLYLQKECRKALQTDSTCIRLSSVFPLKQPEALELQALGSRKKTAACTS